MNHPGARADAKQFPVLLSERRKLEREGIDVPTSIPWDFIAPHERQARANHYQTLERLAERGGLSPWEIVQVVCDRPARPWNDTRSEAECVVVLNELVRTWASTNLDAQQLKECEG